MAFQFTTVTTDAMTYGDINALDALANMSICATVRLATVANTKMIASKVVAASFTGWELSTTDGLGNFTFRFGDGAALRTAPTTSALLTTAASTIGCAYSAATDQVQYCLNAVDAGLIAINNSAMSANAASVNIGNRPTQSNSWNGDIQDVMIWNVTLTLDELQSYHAGYIPRPDALLFWAPCNDKAQPDLIGNATATEVGTVVVVDSIHLVVPKYPRKAVQFQPNTITKLLKVINETEDIGEALNTVLALIKVINETERSVEDIIKVLEIRLLKIINESVTPRDGDSYDLFDPAGKIQETMSDGTVWTTYFPPFITRTRWS